MAIVQARVALTTRVEKAQDEADALAVVLRQIADPSYVGNYSAEEVVEIHRKWATDALAAAEEKP